MSQYDPNSWTNASNQIKVGDVFTEEWLTRFRELMLSYNEAVMLLRLCRSRVHDAELESRLTLFFAKNQSPEIK